MASILKVNTIQDATNSNTAMTIDSSGRITTSTSRPHFFCLGFSSTSDDASAGATINGSALDGTWKIMRKFEQVTENYGNHLSSFKVLFHFWKLFEQSISSLVPFYRSPG